MANRFNPPCNCCGCTIIASNATTYNYEPAEVVCFKRVREQTSVRTLVTQQTTTWVNGSQSSSVVTISDETQASDTTTETVTTQLRAGRFDWIFSQSTVPFGPFIVASETGTPGTNGTRTFQPRTQTTTNRSVWEEYRLVVRFDVSLQDNFGRRDGANAPFITIAAAALAGQVYQLDGYFGPTFNARQATAKWLFADAEMPESIAEFDSMWSAGSNGSQALTLTSNSINILPALPQQQTDSLYVLVFSDAERTGLNIAAPRLTLTANDWMRKKFVLVDASEEEAKAWNGVIPAGRTIKSRVTMPKDLYRVMVQFDKVSPGGVIGFNVSTQHTRVERDPSGYGVPNPLYVKHTLEGTEVAEFYFGKADNLPSVLATVCVANGITWVPGSVPAGGQIFLTRIEFYQSHGPTGPPFSGPLTPRFSNVISPALTGEDSEGNASPLLITNTSSFPVYLSSASVVRLRSILYIDDPETEEDEEGERRLSFVPVFPDSNVKNPTCIDQFPGCWDIELEHSKPLPSVTGRGMTPRGYNARSGSVTGFAASSITGGPGSGNDWDILAPEFVIPQQNATVVASGTTNGTQWLAYLQPEIDSGWIDQIAPDNQQAAVSGSVRIRRLAELEQAEPGNDASPFVYPWLVSIEFATTNVPYRTIFYHSITSGLARPGWYPEAYYSSGGFNSLGITFDTEAQAYWTFIPANAAFGKHLVPNGTTIINQKYFTKPPSTLVKQLVSGLPYPTLQHRSKMFGEYWFAYTWSNGTQRYERISKGFVDAFGGPVPWVTSLLNSNPFRGDRDDMPTAKTAYYVRAVDSRIVDDGPMTLTVNY